MKKTTEWVVFFYFYQWQYSDYFAHLHDILHGERAFVHPRRSDPDVTVPIPDGNISARGGGHAAFVNPSDDHIDLLHRMH